MAVCLSSSRYTEIAASCTVRRNKNLKIILETEIGTYLWAFLLSSQGKAESQKQDHKNELITLKNQITHSDKIFSVCAFTLNSSWTVPDPWEALSLPCQAFSSLSLYFLIGTKISTCQHLSILKLYPLLSLNPDTNTKRSPNIQMISISIFWDFYLNSHSLSLKLCALNIFECLEKMAKPWWCHLAISEQVPEDNWYACIWYMGFQ